MPPWMQLGRRRSDIGLMIDFHKHRAIVRAHTAWIQGCPLELIPEGPSGFYTGMVLVSRKWNDLYFLIERKTWKEDDYFDYAEKRILELGIKKP